MKIYTGKRLTNFETIVRVNDEFLSLQPSLRLRNHSPTGFEWGYNGSGPSQLALAILLDCFEDNETALKYYQKFRKIYVAKWKDEWSIEEDEIRNWLNSIKDGEDCETEKVLRNYEDTKGGD